MLPETYTCFIRLKSSAEEDAVPMQPGSGETHILYVQLQTKLFLIVSEDLHWQPYSFPDSAGDDLIVEIQDSKGKHYGRVLAQLATITEDLVMLSNLSWWHLF